MQQIRAKLQPVIYTSVICLLVLIGYAPGVSATLSYSATIGTSGTGTGQMRNPWDVERDSSGKFYVSIRDYRKILVYNADGTYNTEWNNSSSGSWDFGYPLGMGIDSNDNVYVIQDSNSPVNASKVMKFSSDGTYISSWGSAGSGNGQFGGFANDVEVDNNDYVYVSDHNNHRVQKFDTDGNYVSTIGSSGSGNGQMSYPRHITFDSSNNLYVVETGNYRIQVFDTSGSYVRKWGSLGSGNGQFTSTTTGIEVDASNNVYVGDGSNHRVQKFTSTGTFVEKFGSSGTSTGQFAYAFGVVADDAGYIYVADYNNHRVQKLLDSDVAPNSNPSTPTSLGGSTYVDGSFGADTTPTLSFTLSDTNGSDTVKYKIQIDDTADFGSPVTDYTSALAAQGSTSFTVGQAAGSGSYTTGAASQILSDGSYYWRVKAIDNSAAESSYATANSGGIAFKIDATEPNAPGAASTTTPTTDTTPTWSWTAASDSGVGLAATPYTVQWSQNSGFSSSVFSTTTASATYTHTDSLADGTWYMRIRAKDSLDNTSSYSANGSVVIDTTAPSTPSTPSASTSSTDTTPTWSWTAASDSGVGLAATPYTVQWSTDSSFGSNVYATTATDATFTHSSALPNGTWYFRVKAKDSLDNYSSYSSAGSLTIAASTTTTTTTTPSRSAANTSTTPTEQSDAAIIPIDTLRRTMLNDFPTFLNGTGKKLELLPAHVVHFKIKEETHTATVKEVAGDYAIIVIASEPMTVKLNVGDTKRYDVNRDGTDDIVITLEGVANGIAQLKFAQIVASHMTNHQSARFNVRIIGAFIIGAMIVAGISIEMYRSRKIYKT